jgi:hypothetical protein
MTLTYILNVATKNKGIQDIKRILMNLNLLRYFMIRMVRKVLTYIIKNLIYRLIPNKSPIFIILNKY